MIFKQDELLGGKIIPADWWASPEDLQGRNALYQSGVDALTKYFQLVDAGTTPTDAFAQVTARLDANLVRQMTSLSGNKDQLKSYQGQLQAAVNGLNNMSGGLDKAALKTKALGFATQALNFALGSLISMGISMLVGITFSTISKWIDRQVHEAEYLAEAGEAASAAIEDLRDNIKSLNDTVIGTNGISGIAQEYAELAQGVSAAGNNISLSADQYDRFLELSNQLAELFPTLDRRYDENGNAIVDLTGDVDGIVASLKEWVDIQKDIANTEILTNAEDVIKDVNRQIEDLNESISFTETNLASVQHAIGSTSEYAKLTPNMDQATGQIFSYSLGIDLDPMSTQDLNNAVQEYQAILQKYGVWAKVQATETRDLSIRLPAEVMETYSLYADVIEQEWASLQYSVQDVSQTTHNNMLRDLRQQEADYQAELAAFESQIAAQRVRLSPIIDAQLSGTLGYAKLSEEFQNSITSLASMVDVTDFGGNDAAYLSHIQESIAQPLIALFSSDYGPLIEQAMASAKDPSINSRSYLEYVSNLMNAIGQSLGIEDLSELEENSPIALLFEDLLSYHQDTVDRFDARMAELMSADGSNLDIAKQLQDRILTPQQMERFLKASLGATTFEDALAAYDASDYSAQAQSLIQTNESLVSSFTEHHSKLQEALSADELTIELYDELIGYSEEYRELLTLEGEQVVLNQEAVLALNEAKREKINADLAEGKSMARLARAKTTERLAKLTQQYYELDEAQRAATEGVDLFNQISSLQAEQSALTDTINKYSILESTLSDVSQAYKDYQALMDGPSPEDHYETGLEAVENLQKGLESGKLGTAEFTAGAQLMIPDSVIKKAKQSGAAAAKEIGSYYNEVLLRYFAPNENGDYTQNIENFLKDAEQAQLMYQKDGAWFIEEGKTLADFVGQLNLTEGAVESLFQLMNAYDFGGDAISFSALFDPTGIEAQVLAAEKAVDDLIATRQRLVERLSGATSEKEKAEIELQLKVTDAQLEDAQKTLQTKMEEWELEGKSGLSGALTDAETLELKIEDISNAKIDGDTSGLTSALNVASGKVDRLADKLKRLPTNVSGTVVVRTSFESSTKPAGMTNGEYQRYMMSQATGTAHAHGSAYGSGTIPFPDSWRLKTDEDALTGELGPEMIVRGNQWFLTGSSGAEFAKLKKGDIIFNHRQTAELMTNGRISGRGRAKLDGSLPHGVAHNVGVSGSFIFQKYKTKNSQASSSQNYTGSGYNGKADKEEFSDVIDWIEKELDRLQRKIDQTAIVAESPYKTFSQRNKALADEYDLILNKMQENSKGIARYEAEAKSVGLSETYAAKVRNGTIDIEAIEDEGLKEKIELYAQWYEKALDLKDENAELEETLRDLAAQNFENLITEYEGVLGSIESKKELINTLIDRASLMGEFVSKEFYNELIEQEEKNLNLLSNKRQELNDELNALVDSGEVEMYSEKWYEYKAEIENTDIAIAEATNSMLEYNNAARELDWERFDYAEERIGRVIDETKFLADLMGDDNLFDPETGAATDKVMTLMGLHSQAYTAYMDQAEQYGDEIEAINAELARDPTNQLLIARKEELIDAQHEAVLSANEEKQAAVELAAEGYKQQLDAMDKLIEKKKAARDADREMYEYERDITKQTSEIANIQKELAVYEQQNTEEARKKVQELRTALADAEENLQDTQYEKFISDQDKMFDVLMTEYETWIDERLANTDELFNELIDDVNANSEEIQQSLEDLATSFGVDLSTEMQNIWASDNPVASFNGEFSNYSTSVLTELDKIRQLFAASGTKSDKEGKQQASQVEKGSSSIGTGTGASSSKSAFTPKSPSSTTSSHTAPSISYGTGTITNASGGLKLYSEANSSSKSLGTYKNGASVTLLERVNNGWYKVRTSDGKVGYMSSAYLDVQKAGASATKSNGLGRVIAPDGLRLRASNSTSSKILGAYKYGTEVTLTDKKGNWYKVKTPDNKEGWMSADWLKILQKGSFSKGGIVGNMIKASGEDGFILARSNEGVLTEEQISLLRETVGSILRIPVPALESLADLSVASGRVGGEMNLTIEHLELPNVQDPADFAAGLVDALKNDTATRKAIRAITIDQLAGKNSLSVRKY